MHSPKIRSFFFKDSENQKLNNLLVSLKSINKQDIKILEKQLLHQLSYSEKKLLLIGLLANNIPLNSASFTNISDQILNLKNNLNKRNVNPLLKFFNLSFLHKFKKRKDNGHIKKNSAEIPSRNNNNNHFIEMYINIGKDRKIYPQHLVQFIRENMKIRDNQIKDIKIFDKFSFFKISKDLSEKAVILLSVRRFRGKQIKVAISKQQ